MGVGTNGYSSTVIGISSQMVATLTNGYCSIAHGSQYGFEMETEEGRSEHLQSIDNRRTSHFH
jgi:hypothetical protein